MSDMTKAVPDQYLAAVVADEFELAPLLGWSDLLRPREITPNCYLMGVSGGERGLAARLANTILPRWRRDWSAAGYLIDRCELSIIRRTATGVTVSAPFIEPVYADFTDHPNHDDAIRYAMVRVAIAYLRDKRKAVSLPAVNRPPGP